MFDLWIRCSSFHAVDSLAERSKAPDSSSGGAIRVGSNPTAVILSFDLSLVGSELEKKEVLGGFEPPSLDSESRVLTVTPQDHYVTMISPKHAVVLQGR